MVAQSPATAGCKRQHHIILPSLFFSVIIFLPLIECTRYVGNFNSAQPPNGLRTDLFHRDSLLFPNITAAERVKRAVLRSQARYEVLQHRSRLNAHKLQPGDYQMKGINTPLSVTKGEFLFEVSVGTPPESFYLLFDTASELVWTKYQATAKSSTPIPCEHHGNDSVCPLMSIDNGTSLMSIDDGTSLSCSIEGLCFFQVGDGSGQIGDGYVVREKLIISSQSVSDIMMGCCGIGPGPRNIGGIAGFSPGSLSLPSQLAPVLSGNKFSYCLLSITELSTRSSPLYIGDTASLNATGGGSTPILRGQLVNLYLYYLSLKGISVNDELLNIPAGTFDLQSDGTGGLIIDSGTTFTHLPTKAYFAVKNALAPLIGYQSTYVPLVGLDYCICPNGSVNSTFPSVTFHFDGADYFLPIQNYFVAINNEDGKLYFCLGMLPNQKDGDVSIFGNLQQQNYRILYDNDHNLLSFKMVQACDL